MAKKGRFTIEEQEFIKDNVSIMTLEQLAEAMDRDIISVRAFVNEKVGLNSQQKKEVEASQELRAKPYWLEIQKQFTQEELDIFAFHWKKMWAQFRDDVFHTEEIQIIDTIKLEILMNRSLSRQHDVTKLLSDLNDSLRDEQDKDDDDKDKGKIMLLQQQIAGCLAAQESLGKDYRELQTKKQSMFKDLKATREARIKDIESAKTTFSGLLKQLNNDPEYRRTLGLEMEKHRLAMYKERDRLSQEHKYEDGEYDQPLLTSETVL